MKQAKQRAVFGTALALGLVLGPLGAAAECFSQTFANETYYACSGVLTVVPAGEPATRAADDPGVSDAHRMLPERRDLEARPEESGAEPVPPRP